jgi:hypothetical protein
VRRITLHIQHATLGHGPAFFTAVQSNIDGAVIFRIAQTLASRTGIIRREHAAHESNDRQPMLAVVTQSIKIPPAISIIGNYLVEARSCNNASAALMPESAAIGTPGPGCTLPPARYSPGTLVRACGRLNVVCHP